jgi:excinuclease UvrABC helicase subunit UvrB
LQRKCKIVIKPCDKGAGIIIMDYDKYIISCQKELTRETKNGKNYYNKISNNLLQQAKKDIDDTLKKALAKNDITKQKYEAICPTDKHPVNSTNSSKFIKSLPNQISHQVDQLFRAVGP